MSHSPAQNYKNMNTLQAPPPNEHDAAHTGHYHITTGLAVGDEVVTYNLRRKCEVHNY